jgi:Tfp pilus assembly protein PilF
MKAASADIFSNVGFTQRYRGTHDTLASFDKAVQLDPDGYEILRIRARHLDSEGETEAASQAWQRVGSLFPHDFEAWKR